MKIDLSIDRSLVLPVDYATAEPLLHDLEATIRRFPNLKKLTKLDEDRYHWDMKTMGSRIAKIAHDVSYAAYYQRDLKNRMVRWEPISGRGNASIAGHFKLVPVKAGTEFSFSVRGTLLDVPVPLLYRPLAPTFISAKFTALIERFLERTREAITTSGDKA